MKHSNYTQTVMYYAEGVSSGRILAGTYCKKACRRFLNDYKRQSEEGFPFFFDEDALDEIVDFAQDLVIPDINKKLELLPFQIFIYANIWAWKYKDNPERRRIRQCYIEVARKNSKTTSFLFPFILYDLLTTNAAESYFISSIGDLAEKSYKDLINIINANPELDEAIECYHSAMIYNKLSRASFYGSEASNFDSVKPSFAVIDEFWAYDNDKSVTGMRYGTRARLNGTVCIITSAGLDIGSPCYAENTKCKAILNGTLTDESYFGIIYAYDEKDDWKDSGMLLKSNPALGEFLSKDVLLTDLADAEITPSHQADYKSKTCGIWQNAVSSWIPMEKWNSDNIKKIDYSELKALPCYGALDLSSVNDLTAFTMCWNKDGKYYFKHRFYIPSSQVESKYKKDNINFLDWIEKGYITVLDGETINQNDIYEDIVSMKQEYAIKEIAYDKWQASILIDKLDKAIPEIDYIDFAQNLKNFSLPTKNYEKAILDNIIVDPNPVMTWMISNAVIKPDPNNNYKPLKQYKSSTNRIDGVITSIMALDRCSNGSSKAPPISFESLLHRL